MCLRLILVVYNRPGQVCTRIVGELCRDCVQEFNIYICVCVHVCAHVRVGVRVYACVCVCVCVCVRVSVL